MNEPFLLSNLVELQDLDNKIYKLIDSKSNGENVINLKSLELSPNTLTLIPLVFEFVPNSCRGSILMFLALDSLCFKASAIPCS